MPKVRGNVNRLNKIIARSALPFTVLLALHTFRVLFGCEGVFHICQQCERSEGFSYSTFSGIAKLQRKPLTRFRVSPLSLLLHYTRFSLVQILYTTMSQEQTPGKRTYYGEEDAEIACSFKSLFTHSWLIVLTVNPIVENR